MTLRQRVSVHNNHERLVFIDYADRLFPLHNVAEYAGLTHCRVGLSSVLLGRSLHSSWIGAGMLYSSLAQAPRSICWQRSLQNGRKVFFASHVTFFLQVGQLTSRTGLVMYHFHVDIVLALNVMFKRFNVFVV